MLPLFRLRSFECGHRRLKILRGSLLRKLEWYRRGGELSERQWRDVQAIVRLQGDRLDRARLGHWAAQLGVADLLDRVISPQPLKR